MRHSKISKILAPGRTVLEPTLSKLQAQGFRSIIFLPSVTKKRRVYSLETSAVVERADMHETQLHEVESFWEADSRSADEEIPQLL